jgi:hypothetical protein
MATGFILWHREERRLLVPTLFTDTNDADAAIRRHRSKSPQLAGEGKRYGGAAGSGQTIDKITVTY